MQTLCGKRVKEISHSINLIYMTFFFPFILQQLNSGLAAGQAGDNHVARGAVFLGVYLGK